MSAFDWGIRFEPVVKQIYNYKYNTTIQELGRLLHPTDPRCSASPDGMIVSQERYGRLLEIKCPITRVVGDGIPFDYWCQMQVQMEVTGIDECEYVEVKLDSLHGTATDLSGAEGFVWLLQHPVTCVMKYAYTEAELEGYEIVEKIPWRLNKMYAATVTRDRGWFQNTAMARESFWESVTNARAESPRVIVTKDPAPCLIIGEINVGEG